MTKESLKAKVLEMLENDKPFMANLIDKAINSGCMDIENAEDNFLLPKQLLCAIYKEMQNQRNPLSDQRQQKRIIETIYACL